MKYRKNHLSKGKSTYNRNNTRRKNNDYDAMTKKL